MLYGSQKRFDKNGDGKLTGAEWQRWYWRTFGDEIEAKERRRRNQAAEQQRAEIAAQFVGQAVSIINWMWRDLEHLEGEREDQDIRTMHLALYVISAALQTQKVDESMRYLLRAFWQRFHPTLGESVYQALCTKQVLFAEIGEISEKRLGSFWRNLLDNLPPERRIGKDDDLQELLDDTNRLYNYFRDDSAPEIDFAKEIEPYWAAIRLPEEPEEPEEDDEDEEPEEESEPWTDFYEKSAPAEKPTSGGYYQFCKVQFKDGGNHYTYLTGGLPLAVGDFVLVPVGNRNAEKTGRVTDVFVCSAQDAPYPPEKAKFVLRKSEQTAFTEKKIPPVEPAKSEKAATPMPPVPVEPPVVQSVPEKPASFEVEPVPEAPTFTLPPPSEQDEPKKPKRRIPWGWLAAAALAAFVIFAVPPLERIAETNRQQIVTQQAAEQEKRKQEEQRAEQARLEKEAKQLRQQEEREAALQAEKDAGIPYIGMPESSIDATRTLGTHGMAKSGWAYKKDGTFKQMTYYWYTNKRTPIFTAVCQDGKVIETQKNDGYWSGNTLLVPVVKPDIPTTFHSGSSGSVREDYDNPEDLYEDNRDWYDDEDEAWDEWENG